MRAGSQRCAVLAPPTATHYPDRTSGMCLALLPANYAEHSAAGQARWVLEGAANANQTAPLDRLCCRIPLLLLGLLSLPLRHSMGSMERHSGGFFAPISRDRNAGHEAAGTQARLPCKLAWHACRHPGELGAQPEPLHMLIPSHTRAHHVGSTQLTHTCRCAHARVRAHERARAHTHSCRVWGHTCTRTARMQGRAGPPPAPSAWPRSPGCAAAAPPATWPWPSPAAASRPAGEQWRSKSKLPGAVQRGARAGAARVIPPHLPLQAPHSHHPPLRPPSHTCCCWRNWIMDFLSSGSPRYSYSKEARGV